MTDQVAISLITGAFSLAAAIVSLLNNRLAQRNSIHINEAKDAITTLEKNTNSIKDALVKVTGEEAFNRGLKIGAESAQGPQGEIGPRGPQGAPG